MFSETQIVSFIFVNLLAILIFGIVYFLFKETYRINNNPSKWLRFSLSSFAFVSIVLSYIFISMSFVNTNDLGYIKDTLWMSPSLVFIIIIVTSFDKKLTLPSMMGQITGFLIILIINWENIDNIFLVDIAFELLLYLFVGLLIYLPGNSNLDKKNGRKLNIILISYVLLFIFTKFLFISIKYQDIQVDWYLKYLAIYLLYLILIIVILRIIVYLLNRIYSNFNELETFNSKDDISYYKISLAQKTLKTEIIKNKIENGALVLFDIKTDNEMKHSKILDAIREKTKNEYRFSFFFKANVNYYGAFYEIKNNDIEEIFKGNKLLDRNEKDQLSKLQKILNQISTDEDIKINASASIYGFHSYLISELIEYNQFILTPLVLRANKNSIVVYDYKRVKHRLQERSKVLEIPYDLEKTKFTYLRAFSKKDVFYPEIKFNDEEESTIRISEIIKNRNFDKYETIMRHTSYQTIRNFNKKDSSLVIYYDETYFSSKDFNYKTFIKKINRYISTEKLIIGFSMKGKINKQLFLENKQSLENKGVEFALLIIDEVTQEQNDLLEPKYIIDLSFNLNLLKNQEKRINIKTEGILLNSNLV